MSSSSPIGPVVDHLADLALWEAELAADAVAAESDAVAVDPLSVASSNGYCLLPPLQSCDKGNACLTCGVFVTDTSYLDTLNQQLAQTTALIERTTAQFQDRHGNPMPADNVWLTHRTAERDALLRLLAAMKAAPGRAVQGAGTPTGPTPIDIDLTRHRKTRP